MEGDAQIEDETIWRWRNPLQKRGTIDQQWSYHGTGHTLGAYEN